MAALTRPRSLHLRGGGSKTNKSVPDSFKSRDTLELILGLGEGPWWGPENGAQSLYIDQTPIVSAVGKSNFSDIRAVFYPGSDLGETIKPYLGGFSSPIAVGVSLAQSVPVVRDGLQQEIDWVEMRLIIQALYKSTDDGTRAHQAQVKIEYRENGDPDWLPAVLYDEPSPPLPSGPEGSEAVYIVADPNDVTEATGNVTASPTTPDAPGNARDVWLDTLNNYEPHIWDGEGEEWVSNAVADGDDWTFTDAANRPQKVFVDPVTSIQPDRGNIKVVVGSPIIFNGAAWTPPWTNTSYTNGVIYLNEKISTQVVREVRFKVPNVENTYQYRITQLTPDSSETEISEIAIESIQEVRAKNYSFPGTSALQFIARASDQLSGEPTLQGIYKMRMVKVPVNLNLETYEYEGVWDGTYKIAWTDSVPWIFMDFVENTRFGLSRVFPHVCDKWKIYEWAQHTDTWVDDGRGGLRRRWTFNHAQRDKIAAKEFAQIIASAGGARYLDDGNGLVTVLFETPDEPVVALFTNENVKDNLFRYTFTDRLTRSNQVLVRFKNKEQFYRSDRRLIQAEDDIAIYGMIPEEFEAVGCRDVSEALARARYRLVKAQTEKQFVSFETHRKGRYLAPWQLIAIADADASHGVSGTVKTVTGSRTFTTREPVTLEDGFTYTLQFDIPNPDYPATSDQPFKLYEYEIVTEAGTVSEIEVDDDLPELPEFCTFSVGCADTIGVPKVFRVMTISEVDGDPDKVQITALECNRSKWAYIDGSVPDIEDDDTYAFYNSRIEPVENLSIDFRTVTTGNVSQINATISWDKSASPYVSRYKVFDTFQDAPPTPIGETSTGAFEIEAIALGLHTFTITPIDPTGRPGPSKSIRIDVTGDSRELQSVSNLRLSGGGATFPGTTAVLQWDDETPDAEFSHYLVEVRETATDDLLRSETTTVREWTYDLDKIRVDGFVRATTVVVYVVDRVGNVSFGASKAISNPAPAAPSFTLQQVPGGVEVRVTTPADADFVGYKVYASDTDGFTPDDGTNLVFKGAVPPILTGPSGDTIYVRVAAFDQFGEDGLNVAAQQTATYGAIAATTVVPGSDLDAAIGDMATAAASAATAVSAAAVAETAEANAVAAQTAAETAEAAAALHLAGSEAAQLAAEAAETASQLAQTAAETAQTAAETAATNATAAQTAAETALTAAEAEADAAVASALAAAASETAASGYATSASNSATSASGDATAAASSASAAAASASAASGSASAASTSASAANTSATNASNSASAAATSAVSAQSVANRIIPDRPAVSSDFLNTWAQADPDSATAFQTAGTVTTATGEGSVREFIQSRYVVTRGGLALTTGATYRGLVRSRVTTDGTDNRTRVWFRVYDASWSYLGTITSGSVDVADAASNGWRTHTVTTTTTSILATYATAAYVRLSMRGGANTGGSNSSAVWQIAFCRLQDITSETAAATFATAAATSASSASTSASDAATSASAASTSATNAATSAGAASTSATNASNSATTASGHAATASTQATNAANSATAAAGSATAASSSASTASTQATNAANSATAAMAAQVAAESARDDAQDEATAAASSASSASTSASAAATSASAASTSATNAATSAGAASTSATNASNSATTASGHAATASTQATNAANSATAAAGSATAAAGSASTASTQATNAANSATAAAASSVSAQSVATRLLPDRPATKSDFLSTSASGSTPDAATPLTAGTVVSVAGRGDVLQLAGITDVFTRGALPVSSGRTFRLQYSTRVTVDGTDNRTQSYFAVYDASWTYLGTVDGGTDDAAFVVADGWQTFTRETTSTAIVAAFATAAYVRARVRVCVNGSATTSGATAQLEFQRLRDITSEAAAAGSATAAATSASSAATSAGAASTSASAASTSATNAATSAGNASTSATNASNSATTAAGHASTASTQATNAANSATAAAGSASAASSSASTASTHATNAGNSATAASSSATTASSARDAANATAAALLPSTFDQDGQFWTATETGLSNTGASITSTYATVSGVGRVLESVGFRAVSPKGLLLAVPNAVYEVEIRARVTVNSTVTGGTKETLVGNTARLLNADGTSYGGYLSGTVVGAFLGTKNPARVVDGWLTFKVRYTIPASPAYAFIRPRVYYGFDAGGNGDGTWQVASFKCSDVTNLAAAEGQASAAATSASSAATSATAAGTSASAAATSATNAATSAGNASTSETNASNSATTASGHAATASTQATNAANSATAAAGSASAASTSASTASTAATNASNSATAAAASEVSARSTANRLLPEKPGEDQAAFTSQWNNYATPTTAAATLVSVAGEGQVFELSGQRDISTKSALPVVTGRTYRVLHRSRVTTDGTGTNQWQVWVRSFAADGTYLAAHSITAANDTSVTASEGWQTLSGEITAATILAAQPTAAYIRGHIRGGHATSSVWQLSILQFRDVTSESAAAGSASAAATSASTASTQASNAATSASAASTSATNAAASASSASSSASTATTQASNASASASAAATSATTAANYVGAALSGLLQNAQFLQPLVSSIPTGWENASNGVGSLVDRNGSTTAKAFRLNGGAGANAYIRQWSGPNGSVTATRKYYIRVRTWLQSGTYNGACVWLSWKDSGGTEISSPTYSLADTPTTNGATANNHSGLTTWEIPITAPASAVRVQVNMASHTSWATGGNSVANSIDWYECDIVPETFNSAGVTELRTAMTDGGGAYSYYGMKVDANGRFASIEAMASSKTNISAIKMIADKFLIKTATTDKQIFSTTSDLVEINADLKVGGGITVGGEARLKVALESIRKTGADGAAITWAGGASIGNVPEYVLDISNLAALAAGEQYSVYLTGVTAVGATVYAKILTPGTTTQVSQTTDAAGGGGDPDRVMAKTDSADAYDGVYNFRVKGDLTITSTNEGGGIYSNNGSVTLKTYFNDGGGWDAGPDIVIGSMEVGIPYISTSDGSGTYSYDVEVPISWGNAIGAGGTYDFGVDFVSGTGTLADLFSVTYMKQTATGTRTASPNGETVKITAFPRNA